MPTTEECRRSAEEYLRWADETPNEEERDAFLEMARIWTQLELSSAKPNGGGDGAAQDPSVPAHTK
jgi:hypothetical protein